LSAFLRTIVVQLCTMPDEPNEHFLLVVWRCPRTVRISYTASSVISTFFPGLRFAFTGPLTFPREKPEVQLVRLIPNRR